MAVALFDDGGNARRDKVLSLVETVLFWLTVPSERSWSDRTT